MTSKISTTFTKLTESSRVWTWTLFRLLVASMFMTHGYAKLFGENPQPLTGGGVTSINIGELISLPIPLEIKALFITGMVEFFGGFLILIGLGTPVIALVAAFIMIMAYLTAHLAWFPTLNRGELATMYIGAFLIISAYGAGPYSIDNWLALRRQNKETQE